MRGEPVSGQRASCQKDSTMSREEKRTDPARAPKMADRVGGSIRTGSMTEFSAERSLTILHRSLARSDLGWLLGTRKAWWFDMELLRFKIPRSTIDLMISAKARSFSGSRIGREGR